MQFAKKLIGNEEERAVSPVIGVILMVAITVILAAVIAAFVLDLGQSQSGNVNAGVSIDDSGGDLKVQVTDIGNADHVIIQSDGGNDISAATGCTASGTDCQLDDVGDTMTLSTPEDLTIIAESGSNSNVIQNYDA